MILYTQITYKRKKTNYKKNKYQTNKDILKWKIIKKLTIILGLKISTFSN